MLRKLFMIVLFILLLGLIGHYDYENEVMTHKQDEINKQEVIKDLQIKCLHGDIDVNSCREWGIN